MSKNNETPLDFAMAGIRSPSGKGYIFEFEISHGISVHDSIFHILKCHTIKMKSANLAVSKKNLRSISYRDGLIDFQNGCMKEIASMKNEKFGNVNVSFYDILTKGIIQLTKYAGNESIVQILRSDDCKIKFPIYASMINSNFRKGERRKELLEHGHKIFHSFSNNFPRLPRDCTEEIFSYLSDRDLIILIGAC
jgi:hypothetical protein